MRGDGQSGVQLGREGRRLRSSHLLKLTAIAVLLLGAIWLLQQPGIETLLSPEHIRAWLATAGSFAPLLFILLMILVVVVSPLPSLPLDLAAGVTFGVLLGTVYSVTGAEIGAILSFLIGRTLGREALTRLLRTDIRFCERCSDRHLAIFVFLARLLPIFSFDLISYGAGLTNMPLRTFAMATLLGMIPPTFALTYAGSRVVSGEWLLIVLSLAMVALLLFLPKLVLRYPASRWVRLLRGEMPVAAHVHVPSHQPMVPSPEAAPRCDSCGGPLG